MTRRSQSTPAQSSESRSDRLHSVVAELAENARVLIDIIDQIREDLSWLTRNGIPHQPLVVQVHRMPLLPDDRSNEGSCACSVLSYPVRDPTAQTLSDDRLRESLISQTVERLAEPLGQLAQEQLNALLSMLDDSHRTILRAIRDPKSVESVDSSVPTARGRRTKKSESPPTAPKTPDDPPPPPGQLF